MSIEQEILYVMDNFEYQAKLNRLYNKYRSSSPLMKYKLYWKLRYYGLEVIDCEERWYDNSFRN